MMMFSSEGSLVVRDCITGRRTSSTMIVLHLHFVKCNAFRLLYKLD